MKKERKLNDAFLLKCAGIAGILIFALFIIGIVFNLLFSANAGVLYVFSIIQSLLYTAFTAMFFYGFFILGKKHSKLLKISSLLIIILIIIFYLAMQFAAAPIIKEILSKMVETAQNLGINVQQMSQSESQALFTALSNDSAFISYAWKIILLFSASLLLFFIFGILFGIGLIKAGKPVEYAKVAGILNIVGLATAIVLVGILVLLVAYVFELIILFNESKKNK